MTVQDNSNNSCNNRSNVECASEINRKFSNGLQKPLHRQTTLEISDTSTKGFKVYLLQKRACETDRQ